MKTLLLAIALALSALLCHAAEEKFPSYTSAQATAHIGEMAYVTGTIASVKTSKGIAFVNLGKPYPNQDFTMLSFKANIIKMDSSFVGKRLRVFGKIENYKGTPQIVVKASSQFQVEE